MSVFNNMVEQPRGNGIKLVSRHKTSRNEPVVEIYKEGDNTLVLGFVRATSELRLDALMRQFLCYATKNSSITKVKLEDDAVFTNSVDKDCKYRALIYRALIGKKSIYDKYEFKPSTDINADLELISTYTIEQARTNLLPLSEKVRVIDGNRELFEKLIRADGKNGGDLFGKYVTELPCNDMRRLINILDELSVKIERNGIDNDFLKALRRYYKAHNSLTRNPECIKNGGGGVVRHRTRSSSRTKKYRRNTRTHRRNFRKSSKKRYNH